jgi:cytochrome c-type biogenesis protein CcmH
MAESDAQLRFPNARHCVLAAVVLLMVVLGAQAQDNAASDNAVIAIAEKMYCPVCENIPLDECQTTACLEWKEEIRQQLAAGRDEAQIIEDFVTRFGDQVVGVPRDPTLRLLTILVPGLAVLLALGLGVHTFRRFGSHQRLRVQGEPVDVSGKSEAEYRSQLESDLLARR